MVKEVMKWSARLFPEVVKRPLQEVLKLVGEAYSANDENYGEMEAVKWANGFRFADDIGSRDALLLAEAGHDLETMVRRKQEAMAVKGRMSEMRVRHEVPADDPDFERLLALVNGIPIVLPIGLQCQRDSTPTPGEIQKDVDGGQQTHATVI
jgi:hypothetical protein